MHPHTPLRRYIGSQFCNIHLLLPQLKPLSPLPFLSLDFSAQRAAHISPALHWHLPIHELGQKPIAHKATALPWPCPVVSRRMICSDESAVIFRCRRTASHVLSCPVGDQNPAMGLQCPPPWPCAVAAILVGIVSTV
jgi:hypothetical protein